MKCRLYFTHCYFISFFFYMKNILYSKNIHYAYNFYGTELYLSVCRGVLRTYYNICGGASLEKLQKSLIANVWMVSNYTSSIAAEKVSRMSIFVLYMFYLSLTFLFLELIKKEGVICFLVFCFNLMVLCCIVNFEQF